ncbi:uncharacterized protein IWZ02DRAFT_436559 [Phyllosticta citriasiana]
MARTTPPPRGRRSVPFWAQIEDAEDPVPLCSLCLDIPIGMIRSGDPMNYHDTLRLKTCGHTFGSSCLLERYDADVRVHKCPICRQAFRPPRTHVYDPTEDLIVPEDGNWAMNVPGRPGMRLQGEYVGGRVRTVEDSFYDLEYYDRADDMRLARRTLPPAFYVSGNYGAFRGNVREGQRDERRMLFTHLGEAIGEDEAERLLRFARLARSEHDWVAPKDLERVRYQWVTIRAQHMAKNVVSLFSQLYWRPEYGIQVPSTIHASILDALGALMGWLGEYDGRMVQYEELIDHLVPFLHNTWPTVTQEQLPPAVNMLFHHLVRCLAMARMTREMDMFGRLA